MAEKYFEEWKKALDKFSECVDKDLEEIRRQKAEMQSMKIEVRNMLFGKYIRDDNKLIISSPEIIIGNVDQNGMLKASSDSSHVVIRANSIDIEGVGTGGLTAGGQITNRASVIQSIAVDPGIDGMEAVVCERSQIVNQAKSIALTARDDKGVFVENSTVPNTGITISSDTEVTVEAVRPCETKSALIEEQTEDLNKLKEELKEDVKAKQGAVDFMLEAMHVCLKDQESLPEDDAALYANLTKIDSANAKFNALKQALPAFLNDYMRTVSQLAEVNRQLADMDEMKKELDAAKEKFAENATNSAVNIKSEVVNLMSMDGDGNLRTNEDAAINIQAQSVNVTARNEIGALMENGELNVNVKTIDLSTADNVVKDEKSSESPAVGDINIVTKNFKIEALDYETNDDKSEVKSHTEGSTLSIRMENVNVLSADKEGAAIGQFTVNAKAVKMKSMDVDKESGADKQLAAGSTMMLLSEKMYGGGMDENNKSQSVLIAGEAIAVIAKTTAEIQQEGAVVQLDGGNLSAGGAKTELFGDTTVNGKSEFKDEMEAGKATIDNLEAKSSFKSTNIQDGMPAPPASSSAKLEAKLKEEYPKK